MQLFFLAAGVLACTLFVLRAHSASTPQEQAAPPMPPEVKRLAAWVGTWDAEVEMMGTTSKGSETCRLDCGGYWLITEHTGTFMGQPFQGKGFTGYDAAKGAYSGVWIDSSGGPMSTYANGQFSADGKTFTALVDGFTMEGAPARFEYKSAFPDAKTRVFEIFQVDGGKRDLQMRIKYSKKG